MLKDNDFTNTDMTAESTFLWQIKIERDLYLLLSLAN